MGIDNQTTVYTDVDNQMLQVYNILKCCPGLLPNIFQNPLNVIFPYIYQ